MAFLTSFANLLPPPTFMQLPSVGLDISDTSLKYIQFTPKYGRKITYQIERWGDIDIENGVLDRGKVFDVVKLASILKEVRQSIKTPFVRVSLPEERAYIFESTIRPGTPQSEIRSQLEFSLEGQVPISPRDSFFDYDIVAEKDNTLTVSVVVYARETIMNYYEACKSAGLTPVAFEVEAQSISRSSLSGYDQDAHMIIDFGKTRTGVGIVYKSSLLYTSTIDIGGSDLSKSLRNVLGNKPESELTEIKNTQGLVPQQHDKSVYEALLPPMANIKDEIATRLRYWHSQDKNIKSRPIKSIILCGGSSNLRGVTEYLTETLGVPTFRPDVWQNISFHKDFVPQIERRFSYGYATAIGLALKNSV